MSKCKVIFRDEELKQDTIIECELNDQDELSTKTYFDPPANENTDLGALAGPLAHAFIKLLHDGEA